MAGSAWRLPSFLLIAALPAAWTSAQPRSEPVGVILCAGDCSSDRRTPAQREADKKKAEERQRKIDAETARLGKHRAAEAQRLVEMRERAAAARSKLDAQAAANKTANDEARRRRNLACYGTEEVPADAKVSCQ